MTDSESGTESSASLLLNRHYSTVGIDDVFLDPPPEYTLPRVYLTSAEPYKAFRTWEIIGTIKSCPEDFVVREIASIKRSPELPNGFDLVADLTPEPSSRVLDSYNNPKETSGEDRKKHRHGDEDDKVVTRDSPSIANMKRNNEESATTLSPIDTVRRILIHTIGCEETNQLLEKVRSLQQRAIDFIEKNDASHNDESVVWIPPISIDSSSLDSDSSVSSRGGSRGELHRSFRLAFPLLQSETVQHGNKTHPPLVTGTNAEQNVATLPVEDVKTQTHHWIRVSIDDTFFGLAPSLYRAGVDLPRLYSFRNRGCIVPPKQTNRGKNTRGVKRKQENETNFASDSVSDGDIQVILRLRPDLTREERRPVHHLISNGFRDFETSTIPDYCTAKKDSTHASSGDDTNETTYSMTAIVVKWSKRAQSRAQKKSSNPNESSSSKDQRSSTHTLCVLKKTKTEHLTAIQRLTRAIRCRQSDIGLAGIKDMHAVTYQFCTISDTKPQRVRNAQSHLRSQGIELGGIQRVNWTLNQGDLQGNRFEITIRNVKRVEVQTNEGVCTEVLVPCEKEHVFLMANRIRKCGFINFYGEQRLGAPGHASEVGVRAFDIGRALLQQDFSKAIDLLMTGRMICHGNNNAESPEIRHARQVWKESGGAANLTLKAIPKGDVMARERIVLQGLKRYGSKDPLAALKCLHFDVRFFWINAYQSFIWNKVASDRMKRFGAKVISGDLYRLPSGETNDVRIVGDDISSIDVSQVVLPLPGYLIQYPENEIGALYHDFLNVDNVRFDRNAPSEATAKGGYRPLIAFAEGVEVSFDCKSTDYSKADAVDTAPGTVTDFKLEFDLPSGSYATMLMREMLLTTVARS
jgi:tRNA pseudouridine13 synthase